MLTSVGFLVSVCFVLQHIPREVSCTSRDEFCAAWPGRPRCGAADISRYDCRRARCCWVLTLDNTGLADEANGNRSTSGACYAGQLSRDGVASSEWQECASVIGGIQEEVEGGNATRSVVACGSPLTTPDQCYNQGCCWGITRPHRLPSCYTVQETARVGTTNGDLRIRSNKLEIYYESVWRSVCGAGFQEQREARVACRQLGFNRTDRARVKFSRHTPGGDSDISWINFVHCDGSEARLDQCQFHPWVQHCDNQFQISCRPGSDDSQGDGLDLGLSVSEGDLRLVGSSSGNTMSGRLEVQRHGVWGTVCDDVLSGVNTRNKSFDVICRQMGYLRGGYVPANTVTDGSGPIWLDGVRCLQNHKRMVDCEHRPWAIHNCGHGEDVGARCEGKIATTSTAPIRLSGGPLPTRGRLEVLYNDQWGSVCNHGFTDAEAAVACRQMKLDGGRVRKVTSYGPGEGVIWLSGLQCAGDEWNLGTCHHNMWGNHACTHIDDVSIDCEWPIGAVTAPAACFGNIADYTADSGVIATPDFPSAFQTATTCAWRFTVAREKLISMKILTSNNRSSIWIFDGATSEDASIPINSTSHVYVSSSNVALVILDAAISNAAFQLQFNATHVPTTRALRLSDGLGPHAGRLDVRQWLYGTSLGCATVCRETFSAAAAQVVCRQLGFHGGELVSHGPGSGNILQHSFDCQGNESTLEECPRSAGIPSSCDHTQDVGIECDLQDDRRHEDGDVRLRGGVMAHVGRLEVYHQLQWGTVCNDRFTDLEASVACRQLGYRAGSMSESNAGVRKEHVPRTIWLDELRCHGDEQVLTHCRHAGWGLTDCHHQEDVIITCSGHDLNTTRDDPPAGCALLENKCDWALRLHGGQNDSTGFVQVYHDGEWGAICTGGRNTVELAKRSCKQMGLMGGMAADSDWFNEEAIRRIWLDELECDETDDDGILKDCQHPGWGVYMDSCRLPQDLLAVECLNNTEEEYICRLYSSNIINTFDDQYIRLEQSGGYVMSRYEEEGEESRCSFTVEVIVDVLHTLGQQGPLRPSVIEIFFDSFHIKLRQDHRVMINSTELNMTEDAPYNVTAGIGFIIFTGDNHTTTYFESSKNSRCYFMVGISQHGDVDIELSTYFRGLVRGLCGNWDGEVNDLRTSDGHDVSHRQDRYKQMGDSWMTNSIHSWVLPNWDQLSVD